MIGVDWVEWTVIVSTVPPGVSLVPTHPTRMRSQRLSHIGNQRALGYLGPANQTALRSLILRRLFDTTRPNEPARQQVSGASAIHDPEVDADAVWSRPAPATLDRPLATLLV